MRKPRTVDKVAEAGNHRPSKVMTDSSSPKPVPRSKRTTRAKVAEAAGVIEAVATASVDAATAKLIDELFPPFASISPEASAAAKHAADMLSAPHVRPWLALIECMEATAQHPGVQQSPEHVALLEFLLYFLRDWLSPASAARALAELHSVLSIRPGSGRPTKEQRNRGWADRVDELIRDKTMLNARERYEEVAAEWNANREHNPVKWTTVRDAISTGKKPKRSPK